MTLQASGQISIADIQAELGESGQASLGQASFRSLAGVPTGEIKLSDFYGKSSIIALLWAGTTVAVTKTSAGGKAVASFTCSPDGSTSHAGSSTSDPGQYLASILAAAGDLYEINAVMNSGTNFTGLTGGYNALSSAKTWSLTSNFSQGTFTGNATITIREIANPTTNVETRNLDLTATST